MAGPDVLSFFRALRADPRTVGAVAPSSLALAEAITREITVASAPVIELGPGTGVFTKALLDRGLCETDLTLVECGSDFARLLQVRFPAARVLWMDAARLDRHPLFEATPVGAVVSGLPLLNMTPRKVISILTGAFSYVRPGGAMYQFTYGPRCPGAEAAARPAGSAGTRLERVLRNVPPASVYWITRRSPTKLARV
jgi:phosphatidylethanolamine/phosphatidyl-N-methylethanolamine N-methyltransferase